MIQVVIPTRRRPEYLRVALESIRAQTAVARVGTVIVSENGSDRRSESVCREFPDLPIQYLFQEPEVAALEHVRLLSTIELHPWMAMLHDDDWWAPDHVEVALRNLEAQPGRGAFYSSYLEITAGDPPVVGDSVWRVWVAGGEDFRPPILQLGFPQSLVANLLSTSFVYSSLVTKTALFARAYDEVARQQNSFDNDRMLPMLLADPGGLVYSTIPTVVIRRHPAQDQNSVAFMNRGHAVIMAETTRWLMNRWPGQCQEAASLFNAAVDRIGEKRWREISAAIDEPLRTTLVDAAGFRLWRPRPSLAERLKRLMPATLRARIGERRRALARALRS